MQSTLRTSFAAAALVACTAGLLAQPAFARDHDGWRDGWRRDAVAPAIVDLTPQPGQGVDVGGNKLMIVSARFTDHDSGIDTGSVRLRVDGIDVTGQSGVDEDEIRFMNRLVPGRHVAEVIVRDQAGNTARRSWQFDVAGAGGYGYGDDQGRRGGWGWRR
jgi:hypothetical protein